MTDSVQSWSIIIFAYNEESGIQSVIEKALIVLKQISTVNGELIIVNDGSTDNTAKIIEQFAENNPEIIIVNHQNNIGIGAALLSGYAKARFENVCAIPADGQFNIDELLPFSYIPENTMISFFRKEKIRYSVYRKVLSFTNNNFNRYFLGIKINDVNWVKIYKKEFLENTPPILTSSLVESEICAKACISGFKIIEIESAYKNRLGGYSKGVSGKILLQAIKEMAALFREIVRYKKNY